MGSYRLFQVVGFTYLSLNKEGANTGQLIQQIYFTSALVLIDGGGETLLLTKKKQNKREVSTKVTPDEEASNLWPILSDTKARPEVIDSTAT